MTDSVLFVSHTQDSGPFKVGSHHLASWFARFGYDVVHLSTPHSAVHTLTRSGPPERAAAARRGPWRDQTGVLHIVPRTLLPAQVPVDSYLRALRPLRPRFTFLDQPMMAVRRFRHLGGTLIYRPTDLYPEGIPHRRQERLLPFVDGVAATSEVVLRALGPLGVPTTVITNGADVERFRGGSAAGSREGAVYVGALDDRFDWEGLRLLAERFPDEAIDVAGPVPGRVPSLPPNVHLLGPVPYAEVPALLARHRVGLLLLSRSPLNEGRSPMKLYEYLASGLQVVATDAPGMHSALAPGLRLYDGPAELVARFEEALVAGENEAGAEAAADADWETKSRRLESFAVAVERAGPSRAAPPRR